MKIFIGSSSEAANNKNPNNILLKVAGILRGAGAEPVAWNDDDYNLFVVGNTTIENLETIVPRENIDASVFIYSTDDIIWWRDKINNKTIEKNAPRDNVLFEHGLFSGILGRKKSIIVKYGNVDKMPSDLYGVTYIDLSEDNKESGKSKLIRWVNDLETQLDITPNGQNNDNTGIGLNNADNLVIPTKIDETTQKTELIELVSIPQGTYHRLIDDEEIRIEKSFSISKYLITQSIYHSIMGNNPSQFKGGGLPVENILFREAIIFCNKLSVKEGYQEVYKINNDKIQWNEKAKGYRLPFEAEWEYVLGYNRRDIKENLNSLAWYRSNSKNETRNVGLKKDNKFGLFDLLGNVWEWCFDNFTENPPVETINSKFYFQNEDSALRVLRGGSYADFETKFTKGFRQKEIENTKNRFTGFRIVLQK